jgi:hypothetical protein
VHLRGVRNVVRALDRADDARTVLGVDVLDGVLEPRWRCARTRRAPPSSSRATSPTPRATRSRMRPSRSVRNVVRALDRADDARTVLGVDVLDGVLEPHVEELHRHRGQPDQGCDRRDLACRCPGLLLAVRPGAAQMWMWAGRQACQPAAAISWPQAPSVGIWYGAGRLVLVTQQLYFPGDVHNEDDIAGAVKPELMLDPQDNPPSVGIWYGAGRLVWISKWPFSSAATVPRNSHLGHPHQGPRSGLPAGHPAALLPGRRPQRG